MRIYSNKCKRKKFFPSSFFFFFPEANHLQFSAVKITAIVLEEATEEKELEGEGRRRERERKRKKKLSNFS